MDDEELETYMRRDTSVVEEEGINIIMNAENDKALTICQIINTNHYTVGEIRVIRLASAMFCHQEKTRPGPGLGRAVP